MKKTEINWKSGEVTSWDIDDLDIAKSIESQIALLKEDLFQVRFGKTVILDLGWHPEFNSQGQFVLSVVKQENWQKPIFHLQFRDMENFKQNLNEAIEIARSEEA